MKNFEVTFMKHGELYRCFVSACTEKEARDCISVKENIPDHFEIINNGYNEFLEKNHVGSVIEMARNITYR